MNNVFLSNSKCVSCEVSCIHIGTSYLTDEKIISLNEHHVFAKWLKICKKNYSYDRQDIFLCPNCGLIFINPVLDDKKMLQLIFEADNLQIDLTRHKNEWQSVNFYDDASIWSKAVRVPKINTFLSSLIQKPVTILDVGAHGGEISLNLDLPKDSKIDLLQIENSHAASKPRNNVRQFNGTLHDLASTDYKADVVLALHVLEHTDNLIQFINDLEKIIIRDGILVLEVPYEPHVVLQIASDELFELPHHSFFTLESLSTLVSHSNFMILKTETDYNSHTGVGDIIYPVIRMACQLKNFKTSNNTQTKDKSSFIYTIDRLFKNFSGSLAYYGNVTFKVFIYSKNYLGLVSLFSMAPGYRGILTSNASLDFDNIFTTDLSDIDYVFTLNEQDRFALKQNLDKKIKIQ